MTVLLYLLFILSGAAGLFYESVWSRYLSLFVGHGAYAQVIVLVIFLGGMALGAMLVSGEAQARRPALRLRGHRSVDRPRRAGLPRSHLRPRHRLGLRLALPRARRGAAVGIANGPGGTADPSPIDHARSDVPARERGTDPPPPRAGRLGAVDPLFHEQPGCRGRRPLRRVRAGPDGRPSGRLLAAAILNLLVGLVAFFVAKLHPPGAGEATPVKATPTPLRERRIADCTADASAAPAHRRARHRHRSFVYEVAWIRLLSLVLGSATHSFELMLSAFILGLSLGASGSGAGWRP